jgi:sugar lactone lactonase YvrE
MRRVPSLSKYILINYLFISQIVNAQIISTIAGTGSIGHSGDGGQATLAQLNTPGGVALDVEGNIYISEASNYIRKISTFGIITTIAGNGSSGDTGDGGAATDASIDFPGNLTVDLRGNIYFSCEFLGCIRKVSITGIISTYAGKEIVGYGGDGGPATDALITNPLGLCFDKDDNLYFTDGNQRIRKVSNTGIITTIAGNGTPGFSGDGENATNAMIHNPHGVAIDNSGNIYIADMGSNRIRRISTAGIINTVGGNGINSCDGDGGLATEASLVPWDIVTDRLGNVFFSDYGTNVRYINDNGIIINISGNEMQGFSGDGGPALSAELNHPYGITLDSCGNIFIADAINNRIRKITYPDCHYLGVSTTVLPNDLIVYPNPTNDPLQIDNITAPTNYYLLSLVGATLQRGILKEGNNTVSLNALPAGMYLLEMIDEKGNKTVKKIVKQ